MAMSEEHKKAIRNGRIEASAVKAYLKALAARRPGRPLTVETLEARLARVVDKLEVEADPVKRLELIQVRLDIEDQIGELADAADFDSLESDFKRHAASYSERKGITYPAWREVGVPASVLKEAGIPETRRR